MTPAPGADDPAGEHGQVSVVLLNACSRPQEVEAAVDALRSQLRADADEVVWADRAGLAPPSMATPVSVVRLVATADRGALTALGLATASHRIRAVTDTDTVVSSGWRDRVVLAGSRPGRRIVGGPVRPGRAETPASWAGFFLEYGPHAVAPFTSATGDVAANNVVYSAELAIEPDSPGWKSALHHQLRRSGAVVEIDASLAVMSTKTYATRELLGSRFSHGRHFAAGSTGSLSGRARIARTLAAPLVPLVSYGRLAARAWSDAGLRRPFVTATPIVLAGLVAWSAGEATGYISGSADGQGLW